MPRHASFMRHEGLTAWVKVSHHETPENTIERHSGRTTHGCASLTRKRSLVQTQYRPRTTKPPDSNVRGLHASLVRQALKTRGVGCMYQGDISVLLTITHTPRGDVMSTIRTALHAWLDRHVPLMDSAPSHLDLLDGGRVAVEQVPAREPVAA